MTFKPKVTLNNIYPGCVSYPDFVVAEVLDSNHKRLLIFLMLFRFVFLSLINDFWRIRMGLALWFWRYSPLFS